MVVNSIPRINNIHANILFDFDTSYQALGLLPMKRRDVSIVLLVNTYVFKIPVQYCENNNIQYDHLVTWLPREI